MPSCGTLTLPEMLLPLFLTQEVLVFNLNPLFPQSRTLQIAGFEELLCVSLGTTGKPVMSTLSVYVFRMLLGGSKGEDAPQ